MNDQEATDLVAAAKVLSERTTAVMANATNIVGTVLSVQRGLALDVLALAALVQPADEAEGELLRGACERARMVLDRFGDGSGH